MYTPSIKSIQFRLLTSMIRILCLSSSRVLKMLIALVQAQYLYISAASEVQNQCRLKIDLMSTDKVFSRFYNLSYFYYFPVLQLVDGAIHFSSIFCFLPAQVFQINITIFMTRTEYKDLHLFRHKFTTREHIVIAFARTRQVVKSFIFRYAETIKLTVSQHSRRVKNT